MSNVTQASSGGGSCPSSPQPVVSSGLQIPPPLSPAVSPLPSPRERDWGEILEAAKRQAPERGFVACPDLQDSLFDVAENHADERSVLSWFAHLGSSTPNTECTNGENVFEFESSSSTARADFDTTKDTDSVVVCGDGPAASAAISDTHTHRRTNSSTRVKPSTPSFDAVDVFSMFRRWMQPMLSPNAWPAATKPSSTATTARTSPPLWARVQRVVIIGVHGWYWRNPALPSGTTLVNASAQAASDKFCYLANVALLAALLWRRHAVQDTVQQALDNSQVRVRLGT